MNSHRSHRRACRATVDTPRVGRWRMVVGVLSIVAVTVAVAGCGADGAAPAATPADTVAATAGSTVDPTVDVTVAAAGSSSAPVGPRGALADGPVTVVALGDSLTAGVGDENGQGFVGLLVSAIDATPGRSGSTLVNLGVSGWDSTSMVEGTEGSPAQLPVAVETIDAVVASGGAALATVLIGSNDLWYLYAYDGDEDQVADTYRANLDRTVSALVGAGAVVVVGLPDDQSLRPVSRDLDALHGYFPEFTADDVERMSAMSDRLAGIAADVAAEHGAAVVDTDSPFWADTSTMDDDLVHPDEAGYAALAALWIPVVDELL